MGKHISNGRRPLTFGVEFLQGNIPYWNLIRYIYNFFSWRFTLEPAMNSHSYEHPTFLAIPQNDRSYTYEII